MANGLRVLEKFKAGLSKFPIPKVEKDPQTETNLMLRLPHASRLRGQVSNSVTYANQNARSEVAVDDIINLEPISFLFKVDFADQLKFFRSAFHFEILCEYSDNTVLVASKDRDLPKFYSKLEKFSNNQNGSKMIAKVHDLMAVQGSDEYRQRILSKNLYSAYTNINPQALYEVIVTVSCDGLHILQAQPKRKDETEAEFFIMLNKWAQKYEDTYQKWDDLRELRMRIVDRYLQHFDGELLLQTEPYQENDRAIPTSFDVTIKIIGAGVIEIINTMPYVVRVSEPPEYQIPVLEMDGGAIDLDGEIAVTRPHESDPVVSIIDSGIHEQHGLLASSIISNLSYSYIGHAGDVGDYVRNGGHGTKVAGAVLYGSNISHTNFKAEARLVNVRVLDQYGCMPSSLDTYSYVSQTISRIRQYFPSFKIINHSINETVPFNDLAMSSTAQQIDYLSHIEDLVFVQSAGNIFGSQLQQMYRVGHTYPGYLMTDDARIADPAQSLTALTVGSVGIHSFNSPVQSSVSGPHLVSAFSRTGFGMWGSVKPELVEYGGDYAKDTGTPPSFSSPSGVCGALVQKGPGPLVSKNDVGTSFAAPAVTKILAKVQKLLPGQPGLLYKALAINSASWPNLPTAYSLMSMLKTYGYGIPSEEKSTSNTPYRVTYFTEGENKIYPKETVVFKISVPREFSQSEIDTQVRLDVSLCFSSIPKKTRKKLKNYFSCWVDWRISNIDETEVEFLDRVLQQEDSRRRREIEEDGHWVIGSKRDSGQIIGVRRGAGANQKDWAVFNSRNLPEAFYIAVSGHPGWTGDFDSFAKYSLVASFEDIEKKVIIFR